MAGFKGWWAAAGVAMAIANSAAAAAQAFAGSEVIHAVGLADLQQFVLQRGDTMVDTGKDGRISVLAKTKAGLPYVLSARSCGQRGVVGCQDLFIEVRFAAAPGVTDASVSRANQAFAALKIWRDGPGKVLGVSRYLVLRDGVTRQNVLDNVGLLVGLAPAAARLAFNRPLPASAKTPAVNGGK